MLIWILGFPGFKGLSILIRGAYGTWLLMNSPSHWGLIRLCFFETKLRLVKLPGRRRRESVCDWKAPPACWGQCAGPTCSPPTAFWCWGRTPGSPPSTVKRDQTQKNYHSATLDIAKYLLKYAFSSVWPDSTSRDYQYPPPKPSLWAVLLEQRLQLSLPGGLPKLLTPDRKYK